MSTARFIDIKTQLKEVFPTINADGWYKPATKNSMGANIGPPWWLISLLQEVLH